MNRKLLNLLMMIIFLKVFISQTTYAQNAMQSDLFKHHIIAIDKDGNPRNPVDFKSIDDSLFINNIKKIIELKNSEQHKNKRLVIFIHGGLNSYGSTKQRVLNKT
ncbi:MAG: hypothetical protein JHD28_02125 [Bacteroidia bacterium]|nr:hypothetical protein [Bacteroidia bacterium]